MIAADARTRWGTSLWHAMASARALHPPLAGPAEADVAIVGGGFTGLSTALHAAQAGLSVVVLEAETLAWGASGRNAGFVVPNFAKRDPDSILAELGPERGERLVDLACRSGDTVFRLVAQHAIACDAVQGGWIQPAHAAVAVPRLQARAAQWAARGRPVEVLSREAVTAATGCNRFAGGWIDRSGGVIHPVNYALGLAAAATRAGARLFETTRVSGLARGPRGWEITTPNGTVRAGKVVLATNAYGGLLQPTLRRAYFPLTIFQIATQPVAAAVRARLLQGGACASDTRRNLFTFRFDAEDRLITGGMDVLRLGADRRVPLAIHRRLAAMLHLSDLPPIAYAWSGVAAVMPDFLPHLFDLGPGCIAAIGCNGRGIAITTMLGQVLADWARGIRATDLPVPFGPPNALPLHGLARYAPSALLPFSMVRDALEVGRSPRSPPLS